MSAAGNASSSGSADPLASVITQVQPGQAPAAGLGFAGRGKVGPARPTRVAKSGTAKAAQQAQASSSPASTTVAAGSSAEQPRKKKKKKRRRRTSPPTGGEGDAGEARSSPSGKEQIATVPSSGTSSVVAATPEEGDGLQLAPAIVGASTALPPTSRQKGSHAGDVSVPATTPGAPGIEKTDTTAKLKQDDTCDPSEQDLTEAAQKNQQLSQTGVQSSTVIPSTGTVPSTSGSYATTGPAPSSEAPTKAICSSAASPPSSRATGAATATAPPGPSQPTKQRKKPSPLQKLVAFLACCTVTPEDSGEKRLTAAPSRPLESKSGTNIEMKDRSAAARQEDTASATSKTAAATLPAQAASNGRPMASRVGGSRASSSKQLPQQQQTQRDANKLSPPGKAALAGGVIGGAVGASTLGKQYGRTGSSSARNSLESRSESGVVAPPPGTLTPGGGTQLPREETGDVMSGAVVPPGSSFVGFPVASGGGSATPTSAPSKRGGASGQGDERATSEEETDEYTDDEDETESDTEDSEAPAGVLARGVTTPGQDDLVNQEEEDDVISEEQRLIAQGGMGIPVDENGNPRPLLEPLASRDAGRKCLVLDLDETLVHSSFKMINNADFVVPVDIEGTVHNVYVIKRPGVDEFMRKMGLIYEVVVFTASLSKYADPVLDILDIHQVVRHRLFRESCYNHRGNYVKDLSQLGRPTEESIIIDNSPASYIFHANNAVPISSWFNDPHDTELTDLCPFLADLSEVVDVRSVLDGGMTA